MCYRIGIYLLYFFILLGCKADDVQNTVSEESEQEEVEEIKILFIGNSHTYYNRGVSLHLQRYIERSHLKIKPVIEESTFGGHSLKDHLETISTLTKLESKRWDIVVLQENSAVARDQQQAVVKNIESFNDLILDQGAETYLFMTWAYLDQPEMYSKIRNTYREAKSSTMATLVPVGTAFRTYLNTTRSDSLYDPDGVHPSLEGTFLAATMFYIEIFNQNPRSNNYSAGLGEDVTMTIKDLAWTTLRGS